MSVQQSKPARPRARRWVAFFLALAVLGALAIALPIVYNLGQQLRPEQLDEARRRWSENGPASYDLEVAVGFGRDPQPQRYTVLVRDGRAVFAAGEGSVQALDGAVSALAGVAARGALGGEQPVTVEALFSHIAEVLDQNARSRRRNFTLAVFDPRDGHPRRFIHRVRGTGEREEWNLRLSPAGTLGRSVSPERGP
jgi:hypothetical protein